MLYFLLLIIYTKTGAKIHKKFRTAKYFFHRLILRSLRVLGAGGRRNAARRKAISAQTDQQASFHYLIATI